MADVKIDKPAIRDAAQKVQTYRQAFDDKGTALENVLQRTADQDLKNEASEALKSCGARFTTAFEQTALTLDKFSTFLNNLIDDYGTRGQQTRTGIERIGPS